MRGHRIKIGICTGLLFLLMGAAASAQTNKLGVFFQYNGQDPVGKQLDFLLKEQVRASPSFDEVFDEKQAAFVIPLVTLDPDGNGARTIYSYSILLENSNALNFYVDSYVGFCAEQKIRDCAGDLFTALGTKLEDIRRALMANQNTQSR